MLSKKNLAILIVISVLIPLILAPVLYFYLGKRAIITKISRSEDQKEIYDIAKNSDDSEIILAVLEKLDEQEYLAELLVSTRPDHYIYEAEGIYKNALNRITREDLLKRIAVETEDEYDLYDAEIWSVEKITNQKLLSEVVLYAKDDAARNSALKKINDGEYLRHILHYTDSRFFNNSDMSKRPEAYFDIQDWTKLENIYEEERVRNIEYLLLEPHIFNYYGRLTLHYKDANSRERYSSNIGNSATLIIEHKYIKITDDKNRVIFQRSYHGKPGEQTEAFNLSAGSKFNPAKINIVELCTSLLKPLPPKDLHEISNSQRINELSTAAKLLLKN